MKRLLKRIMIALNVLVCTIIIAPESTLLKMEAATPLFTLGSIPTVNHEVAKTSSINVSNITQYIDAVNNPSIDQINFTANITAATTGQAMGLSVNRDLHINGNGFTLTITGNASFGPAGGGSVGGTHLVLGGTGGTLHLENFRLNRSTIGSGQNDFISIMTGSNETWDIIFDNFISDFSSNQWRAITRTFAGTVNSTRIFLRNNTNIDLASGSTVFSTNGSVVSEPNSNVNLVARSSYAIQGLADGDTKLYVAPNSSLTLGLPPQIWSGNRGALGGANEVNVYQTASLNLVGTGTSPTLTSLDSPTEMVFKVDSDASFKIENTAGPAVISTGSFPIRILGNPNSTLEILGTGVNTTAQMSRSNSEISLVSPKNYNIQNNGTGAAFSGIGNTVTTLSLTETNIGVWLRGQSVTGNPQSPSPFSNVNLLTANTTALAGSSPILDTMDGGWNTSNYSRISYAKIVEIDANDLVLGLGRSKPIESTVVPADAPLTYTSANPSIATVDSDGNVSGVAQGSTTITISSVGVADVFPSSTTISVTVTNNPPIINVPAFTIVPLGGAFNPLLNVTATDVEDGNLIGSVQVSNPVDVNTGGVYVVNYSLTDFNNNTVTAKQVVLVQDGNFVVGTDTIIQARDFTKRPSEVDTTPSAIKTAANVKVYDKVTGLELVNEPVTITEDSGYSTTVGSYPITFEVDQDTASTITVDANVVTGSLPVLTVNPSFVTVNLNESFDATAGVSAIDTEDGNITANIVINNPVNTSIAGVYKVTYSITDTDGNSVSKTRIVLVQDGNFVVGTDTIIQARDFTKRPSEVDTTPSAIKTAANVKVYDKVTGLELVNEPVTITEDSGYSTTVGSYPITFEVDQDTAATITIDAAVVTGALPVLTVNPSFVTVNLNESFDATVGVSAIDTEDGDITANIVINNPVNTSVAGVYKVTYSITDTDGNSVSKTRVVLVQDGNFVVGTDTIIQARDFTKRPSEVDTTPSAIKTAANVKVYDKVTGLELVNEPVTITEDSGYSTTVGSYPITFEVDQDTAATITIDAAVVTGALPVLTVNPSFVTVNLNESFDATAGVSAIDTEDGNITANIVINNPVNTSVAGVYKVTYTITDTDGNSVSKTRVVLVQDGNFVVGTDTIIQARDFTKRPSEVDTTPSAIKTAANVKVYDKVTGLELVNEPVTITEDSGYSTTVGSYPITFEVDQDTAATITIDAAVVTGAFPVLTVNPSFVTVNLNQSFDATAGVTAIDTEDGDITANIVINNPVNTSIAGVYKVTYSITDTDGNSVSKTRIVLVQDGNFVVGTDTIIQARDFTKRPSEVDMTPSAIKTAANVKVYDKVTGLELVNEPVTITEDSGYSTTVGSYPITFEVDQDTAATITIDAAVVTGALPILTVNPSFKEVPINGNINVMTGVFAIDVEDGDITSNIVIDNPVNTSVAGVYTITYTITDSDGNTMSRKRVVLVQDGNFIVGTDTIIQARDFTKRPSEVDTTPSAIKTAANVKVYDKVTGLELVNEPVTITEDSGYSATVNRYPITFEVVQDTAATITIDAHVVTGEAPILEVPNVTEVPLNGVFAPLSNVLATDAEDGIITNRVVIEENTVNTSVVGVYHVDYSVTDNDGNRAEARQIVVINDGEMTVGSNSILFATDFQKRVGQVDTSANAIRTAANVKVYSKETGEELPNAVVNIVDLGGYHGAVGTYPIVFEVSGDSEASKTIDATVITGDIPVLNVPSFRETPISSNFDLLTGVTATDTEDGNLISNVTIVGEFDNEIAGVYTLQYNVVDSDGNRASAEGVILVDNGEFNVGDTTIIQASDFVKRISEVDTSDAAIINAANVKLYNKVSGKEIENPQITINDIGGYQAVAGDYTITFSATLDLAATKSITGTVVSGAFPVIDAPAFTEVLLGDSFDPMTSVTITDDEDADIADYLIVTNPVDTNVAGVYTVQYEVTDTDGNTTKAIQVVLVQNGKFFAGSDNILYAEDFSKRISEVDLSETAILAAAKVRIFDKRSGEELTVADVTIGDLGGYQATVGTYSIKFEAINDSTTYLNVEANVTIGNPPVLQVPSLSEVDLNGTFDAMENVSALDDEDGDITHLVQVTGSVDVNTGGIYTLLYSVRDRDGNIVNAQQIVVVSEGEFVVGDSTILYADDFVKRVGQVDTSNSAILTAANVRVYDKATGVELIGEPVDILNKGGYGPTVGSYPITFAVTNDPTTRMTIVGKVVTGDKPIITLNPQFVEVTLNEVFDENVGVSIVDTEDGNITANVVITGSVNTSVAGVYPLTYTITDSDGNTESLTRVVLVQDTNFVVGSTTIINANDFTKRVGQVNTDTISVIQAANVKIYDKMTGEELEDEVVDLTDLGGYTSVVGSYSISFQVARDVQANTTITANVVTGNLPVITLPESFTEIQLNDPFDPKLGVSATDDEDGDILQQLQIIGQVDTLRAGIYTLTYQVKDSDENIVNVKRVVLVNDGQSGVGDQYVITGQAFTRRLSEVNTTESYIKQAAQLKVYDKFTGLEVTDQAIEILDLGGYTTTPGTYQITFGVVNDTAATVNILATVLTDTPPTLVVPQFTEINLNGNFDPQNGVSAIDDEDGDITDLITISGNVDVKQAGVYTIVYQVIDSDQNKVNATQTVLVNDGSFNYDNGYIIQGKDFKIGLSKSELDDEELVQLAEISVFDIDTQSWISNPTIRVDRNDFVSKIGEYQITFTFNPSITTTVTVYDDQGQGELPKTGDDSNVILFGAIALCIGSILLAFTRRGKKVI